jgi:hypothetical protein
VNRYHLRKVKRLDPAAWGGVWYPSDRVPALVRGGQVSDELLKRAHTEDMNLGIEQRKNDILAE